MTYEWAYEKQYRKVEGHENQHDALWLLANVWPGAKVDRKLDAFWLGPFLEVVEDVFDLLEGAKEFDAAPR